MRMRSFVASGALVLSSLAGVSTVMAEPSFAAHACTKTSSHHCIKGGQFCPKASYGKAGWDAQGRRYVCKENHSHPHWMK